MVSADNETINPGCDIGKGRAVDFFLLPKSRALDSSINKFTARSIGSCRRHFYGFLRIINGKAPPIYSNNLDQGKNPNIHTFKGKKNI